MRVLPIPKLPSIKLRSPEVVLAFDRIRFELEDSDEHGEFNWFAREYPRCYRYHISHAEHRLVAIHSQYSTAYEYAKERIEKQGKNSRLLSFNHPFDTNELYWDFEAYLSATSSALDILARIVGTCFNEQTPLSFNRLCARTDLGGPVEILRQAKKLWVSRMKDYRDCFTHYTPVDTLLAFTINYYSDGCEVRARLPINPNAREILLFRFSRRVELLKYAIATYKHTMSLDRAVAKDIMRLYKSDQFPKRIKNLFFVGQRRR
jgi:hypothetical protein